MIDEETQNPASDAMAAAIQELRHVYAENTAIVQTFQDTEDILEAFVGTLTFATLSRGDIPESYRATMKTLKATLPAMLQTLVEYHEATRRVVTVFAEHSEVEGNEDKGNKEQVL